MVGKSARRADQMIARRWEVALANVPTVNDGTDAPRVTAFAPLKVARYRRMWGAATVSSTGMFMQLTAGPWVMLEMTGSPLMVSLVTTALMLPRLLLTLHAGALADVMDRRSLIVIGQSTSAVSAGLLAATVYLDLLTPELLLAMTFTMGIGAAISRPSFQSFIPELVPRPLLAQAVTLNAAAFNVARSFGPSLGGALIALGLTHVAFGANAVSYLATIGVALTLPAESIDKRPQRRLWRSTVVGIRYVRFTRSIRILILVSAAFTISSASVQALLPSLASVRLGLEAGGFGILFGLLGAGAFTGAATRERARLRLGRHMLPVTITSYGVAGVVVGTALTPVVAGGALFVTGMLWVWTMTTLNASVQIQAPRWVRGRVVSVYLLTNMQPIGAFVGGLIAEVVGPGRAIATMTGLAIALGMVAFRLRLPVLGELSEPEPAPERSRPLSVTHAERVGGSPVVVLNTFKVDGGRVDEFLEVMRRLRRERLRTGATKWALFRDAGDPWVMTEMFEVPDWEEHLAQHARIDARAAGVIRRARGFDVGGGPVSRHLAGVDVSGRSGVPLADQLVTVHARMHDDDGSVPLADSHDSNEADRENASGHSEQSGSVGDDSDQRPGARSQRE